MSNGVARRTRREVASKRKKNEEFEIQARIAQYLRDNECLFCASVAGIPYRPHQLSRMYISGYEKGYPDVAVYEPRREGDRIYHGLFLELKCASGYLRPQQREYLRRLNERGYKAVCCYSLEDAMKILTEYLKLDPVPNIEPSTQE